MALMAWWVVSHAELDRSFRNASWWQPHWEINNSCWCWCLLDAICIPTEYLFGIEDQMRGDGHWIWSVDREMASAPSIHPFNWTITLHARSCQLPPWADPWIFFFCDWKSLLMLRVIALEKSKKNSVALSWYMILTWLDFALFVSAIQLVIVDCTVHDVEEQFVDVAIVGLGLV